MHPDVEALSKGAWGTLERREVPSSGFVVDTLCAALWSVGATQTFEDAVAASVNLGGDSDTVGCVTGMLAGSIYGVSLIPDRWLAPLAWRERLEQTARDLLALRESRT
jgi:ADP-ribosyl-[dinitrogen reductase] hydrolase